VLLFVLAACTAPTLTATPAMPIPPTDVPAADLYGKEVVNKLSLQEPRGMLMGFGSLWVDTYGDTLFRLDAGSGQTQATITSGIGKEPAEMAITEDALWVINSQSANISRIDPKTNQVTDRFKFKDICCSLAVFDGGVWTIDANHTLSRVDIQSKAITSFTLPSSQLTNGPFVSDSGLSVEVNTNLLMFLDKASGTFSQAFQYKGAPIGFSAGLFWTVTDQSIFGVDTKTGQTAAQIKLEGAQAAKFGFANNGNDFNQLAKIDGSSLWIIGVDSASLPLLVKVDLASKKIGQTIHVGPKYYGFGALVIDGKTLWLEDDHNQVLKIQP